MIYKKITLMLVILLLFVTPIIADESFIFKQGQASTLEIPIFEYDITKCVTCSCEISINSPNGTNLVRSDNAVLTDYFAIFTLNETHTADLGVYSGEIHCSNGVDNGASTFEYLITYSGSELSTAEGIVYVIVFVVSLLLFTLCLIGAIKIKWSRLSNTGGNTLEFNDLRYVKLVLWFVSYLLLIWIAFLSMGISQNFLFLNGASTLFNVIYTSLLIAIFPIMVVLVIVGGINIAQDKKYQKALQRGLPYR